MVTAMPAQVMSLTRFGHISKLPGTPTEKGLLSSHVLRSDL